MPNSTRPANYQMSQPPAEFSDDRIPFGYLITFRGSVDRFHKTFGTPMLPPNAKRKQYEQRLLTQPPVTLNSKQRTAVERGIRETCTIRKWALWAFNIRTNHVHSVVSANCKPERVLSALKANATRWIREAGLWSSERSPWVYRGSKKYLWTEKELLDAIAYVLYDQGEPLHE